MGFAWKALRKLCSGGLFWVEESPGFLPVIGVSCLSAAPGATTPLTQHEEEISTEMAKQEAKWITTALSGGYAGHHAGGQMVT